MTTRHPRRVVLVTGAGQGIGRAYAAAFARAGDTAIVADINASKAAAVAEEIAAAGGDALAAPVDIGDARSVEELVRLLLGRYGRLDVLVNNAALFSTLAMRPFYEIPLEEWQRVLHVNVTGTFLMSRAVVEPMKAAGSGRIVNVSSAAVTMGRPNYLHYIASKAAVIGMTRSMGRELGAFGITVNAVLPGAVETEIARETVTRQQLGTMYAQRSIPRAETPEDMVGIVQFLASDAAGFITGQSITVDGGLTHP